MRVRLPQISDGQSFVNNPLAHSRYPTGWSDSRQQAAARVGACWLSNDEDVVGLELQVIGKEGDLHL
jgi:hypothetical protein